MKVWAIVFNRSWWRPVAFGDWIPPRTVRTLTIEQAAVLVVPDRLQILHVYDHGPDEG